MAVLAVVVGLALAGTAGAQRYVVVYRHVAPPGLTEVQVKRAGGDVVAAYHRIGVVVAESPDPGFEASIERFPQVEGAAPTAAYATPTGAGWSGDAPFDRGFPNEPASDGDTFSGLQWGLDQIHAKEAHVITGGSPEVLVGHIDTGVDPAHPDLAPNVDASKSVSCVGGAANADPAAWRDDSGHGTHTAAIIAAADNGTGIVGVAPNVRLAVIKASIRRGASDFFLPEAVICSFMWAASHGVDVANNSYSADATLASGRTQFCETDPDQATIVDAVRRAVQWANLRGVTVVASAGNDNQDMAANACLRLPSEVPGVLTVAGVAPDGQKSSISNFGLGYVDVAAPAGEASAQFPPPSGFILSAWPSYLQVPRLLCDPSASPCPPPDGTPRSYYRFMAGTSQAAAHVSGVAALVVSRFGRDHHRLRFFGRTRPHWVAEIVERTADPVACPPDPRCRAAGDENGFYGHGIVNALDAATRD